MHEYWLEEPVEELEHVTKPCFLILFSSTSPLWTRRNSRQAAASTSSTDSSTWEDIYIYYYFLLIHNLLQIFIRSTHDAIPKHKRTRRISKKKRLYYSNRSTGLLRSLEDEAVLRLAGERNTKLQELDESIREVLEEGIAVLGVTLDRKSVV